jgi:hypothetical protein
VKIKQWSVRLGVTAAFALAMIAGITSPAFAANTNVDLVYQDLLAGEMMHVDDGDKFRVYDWRKDGHGTEGTLQYFGPRGVWVSIEWKYNGSGSGTYVEFQHDVLNIWLYRMKICLQDGGNDLSPIHCDYVTFSE